MRLPNDYVASDAEAPSMTTFSIDWRWLFLAPLTISALASTGGAFWIWRRWSNLSRRPEVPPVTGSANGDQPGSKERNEARQKEDCARIEGRNQLLENSHYLLQQELQETRARVVSLHTDLAREQSLRLNLEAALDQARAENQRILIKEEEIQSLPSKSENGALREIVAPLRSELEGIKSQISAQQNLEIREMAALQFKMGQLEEALTRAGQVKADPIPEPPPKLTPQALAMPGQLEASRSGAWKVELDNFLRRTGPPPRRSRKKPTR